MDMLNLLRFVVGNLEIDGVCPVTFSNTNPSPRLCWVWANLTNPSSYKESCRGR
jgi:hypothetical protein